MTFWCSVDAGSLGNSEGDSTLDDKSVGGKLPSTYKDADGKTAGGSITWPFSKRGGAGGGGMADGKGRVADRDRLLSDSDTLSVADQSSGHSGSSGISSDDSSLRAAKQGAAEVAEKTATSGETGLDGKPGVNGKSGTPGTSGSSGSTKVRPDAEFEFEDAADSTSSKKGGKSSGSPSTCLTD